MFSIRATICMHIGAENVDFRFVFARNFQIYFTCAISLFLILRNSVKFYIIIYLYVKVHSSEMSSIWKLSHCYFVGKSLKRIILWSFYPVRCYWSIFVLTSMNDRTGFIPEEDEIKCFALLRSRFALYFFCEVSDCFYLNILKVVQKLS